MALAPGTRIGPYDVLASVGAGGMGEVYRARDTRLQRDVALKLLPTTFATDPQRMSRFAREAQLLASLSHPNIAAIHGLEETDGQRAIVMEFVEGRDAAGPLPIDDALRVARQIAEAIEAAHDRGVIHRDLKPANIRVTPDGVVKVLDFGLAKALDGGDEADALASLTHSPTVSLGATQAGLVLGTAAYMAPEQAKGRPADRRADIWAFGAVLYELLTGQRVFGGDSVAETLASVMKDAVAFGALPAETPDAIRRLLRRCLERDLRRRLQSIGEARIVIEDVLSGAGADASQMASPPVASHRSWLPWTIAAAAAALAAVSAGWSSRRVPEPTPVTARFRITPPDGTILTRLRAGGLQLAVSPDGRLVAFVADDAGGGSRSLWVQAIDSLTARKLDRPADVAFPFWSPDSQHIGYFSSGKLMRTSVTGGAPLVVAEAPDGEGGSWFHTASGDGVIVFAPSQQGALHQVAATGGASTPVTALLDGESGHAFPQVLPDGRMLFTARGERAAVFVQARASDQRTKIADGAIRAAYVPPGYLLYTQGETLLAQRFDVETLARRGEPWVVATDVRVGQFNARAAFAAATAGLLVHRSVPSDPDVVVRSHARDGTPGELVLEAGAFSHLELSPNGQFLAVARGLFQTRDLWVKDLSGGTFSRLTNLDGAESQVAWSPDSRRVAFVNDGRLFHGAVGSGTAAPAPGSEGYSFMEQWTPDGLAMLARTGTGSVGLVPAPREGAETSTNANAGQPLVSFRYNVDHFQVSPDGRLVAYTSEESGRVEVMVAPFPAFAPRRQVSVSGGAQPRWRGDSKELFFHSPDQQMFAVDITPGDPTPVERSRVLFRTNPAVHSSVLFNYAVTPDGQRFFLREPVPGGSSTGVEPLHVVVNWAAAAK